MECNFYARNKRWSLQLPPPLLFIGIAGLFRNCWIIIVNSIHSNNYPQGKGNFMLP